MADANNKLRLQIVTELDAAGIKATKEQVDQLELGIRRSGNTVADAGQKFGKWESFLGKLPGPLGKVGSMLGGLAGQATMVAGAFTMGWNFGEQIVELQKKLGLFPGISKESAKAAKNYAYELRALKDQLELVATAEMKRMDAAAEAGDKALKKIDDQTAAYFRQATALQGLSAAGNNAALQQLEREKYENMRDYSIAGYSEAAEQIGKYYDVIIAEEKSKQRIEDFDRESLKLETERTKNEEAYAAAAKRAANAKYDAEALERRLSEHRKKNSLISGVAVYDNDRDAMLDDQLEKLAERAKKDAEKAAEVMQRRGEKLETVDKDMMRRQMERASLVAGENDQIVRAADAYDDFVNGNKDAALLGSDFGDWGKEILQKYEESHETERRLLEVVQSFMEKFDRATNGGD